MFTCTRWLLLCISKGNGKSTNSVLGFVLLLFLHAGTLYANCAAVLASVEAQVHGAIQQVGDNVLRLIYFLVILGPFRVQRAEVQRRNIFSALLGQFLVASEILPRTIYVSHGFIEQAQFPFGESKLRCHVTGPREVSKCPIIFALGERAIYRRVQPASFYSILRR